MLLSLAIMASTSWTESAAPGGARVALRILPAVLALAIALPAAGQDAPPPLQVTTDVGFVNAAGNTDVTTFNVGEELLYTTGPRGIKQTFGVVYGRTDGEVSTSLWRAGIRGDRSVGGRLGIYLLGAFDRNTFAGITRRFEDSYLQLTSEVLPNLEESEDLRVNSGAELVAPISAQIAMKLAYALRYDNLPEPGFEKTDRLFTAGLQISF